MSNFIKSLKRAGFSTSKDFPEIKSNYITYYHYTYEDRVNLILSEGIKALRVIIPPDKKSALTGKYRTEGFFCPFPDWWVDNQYFGSIGFERVKNNIGDVLLAISIPIQNYHIFVADFAHILILRFYQKYGLAPIDLGYDLSTRDDARWGFFGSYIPLKKYHGQHIAPVIQIVFDQSNCSIPPTHIKICDCQPMKVASS